MVTLVNKILNFYPLVQTAICVMWQLILLLLLLSLSLSLSLSHSLSLSLLDRLWLMLDRCWVKIHLLSLFVIPNRHSPCIGTHTFLSLSVSLSLSLSITNRFISLELCLTTLTGVRLAICLSVFLSIYLFVYLSVYLFIYLSIYLYIYLFFSICSLKYLSQFGYFAFCLFSINWLSYLSI